MKNATLELNGLRVSVDLTDTEHGPLLTLGGENCNLEGEMPGEYYLTPLDAPENPDVIRASLA